MRTMNMYFSLLFLAVASLAMAQSGDADNREKFQVGLKAGMNYSNIYNSSTDEFDADGKFGFAGGASFHIPLGPIFGFQPELLISQKGFKGKGSLLGFDYSFKRTTTFIDIPLQFAIKPSKNFTIVLGPQYSILLKQKDSFESTLYSVDQEEVFRNEDLRRNMLGAVVGFDINIRHISIGARGGLDFIKNNGDGSSSSPKYKNMWAQLTVGYLFYKN